MEKVIEYLNKTLKEKDTVIIACSGGPDSMCLLSLLVNLDKNINIICAHVNHNIRKQSIKEYSYVKKYCSENGIIFEGIELKEKYNNNFEEQARKFRYSFFEKLYKKYSAQYILTAHHGDDLIETILMRISRGSNLSGYAGIKLNDGKYIRPLLLTNKDEIIKYLNSNNIKFFWDKTNDENEHTRNRYRHFIVNFLKKENKNVYEKYYKFSNELSAYDSFMKKYIYHHKFIDKDNNIIIDKIKKEDKVVIKKAIELIISNTQMSDYLPINDQTVEEIIKIINSKKSNASIDLSNGYVAKKEYDRLFIDKKQESSLFEVEFDELFENESFIISKQEDISKDSNSIIRLNSEDITLPIIIRNRKDGDVIDLKNSGHQKIKKVFIDAKVPMSDRNSWPIVCDGRGKILWIPNLKKSKFAKDKNEKYDIILFSERKTYDKKQKK